jgi:hypothetical protein
MKENLQSIKQFKTVFLQLKRHELSCSIAHEEDHILPKSVWNTSHKHVHTAQSDLFLTAIHNALHPEPRS